MSLKLQTISDMSLNTTVVKFYEKLKGSNDFDGAIFSMLV